MDRESKFVLCKVAIDFLILFCVGIAVLILYLWGQPYERGFFCDDESLMHPYKDSTVTSSMLYIVGIALPVVTMILIEFTRLRNYKAAHTRLLLGYEIPAWLWEAYKVVGIFLFGCACQQLTTDVAKYTIGRLRPHFFNVCKPDIDCSSPFNQHRYIEKFTCKGADDRRLKEMRLSFPSGHSSFSAYCMLYFSLYLHKRFSWRGSKLLRHGIQFSLMLLTWYTAMSRISDYKHHWSDVLAGFSIGIVYAVIVFCFASNCRSLKVRQMQPRVHDAELHTNGSTPGGWQV